jgi:hypothetical protein
MDMTGLLSRVLPMEPWKVASPKLRSRVPVARLAVKVRGVATTRACRQEWTLEVSPAPHQPWCRRVRQAARMSPRLASLMNSAIGTVPA